MLDLRGDCLLRKISGVVSFFDYDLLSIYSLSLRCFYSSQLISLSFSNSFILRLAFPSYPSLLNRYARPPFLCCYSAEKNSFMPSSSGAFGSDLLADREANFILAGYKVEVLFSICMLRELDGIDCIISPLYYITRAYGRLSKGPGPFKYSDLVVNLFASLARKLVELGVIGGFPLLFSLTESRCVDPFLPWRDGNSYATCSAMLAKLSLLPYTSAVHKFTGTTDGVYTFLSFIC